MSCTGCAASFGFLRKEHGCKNCGYSFCSKCLSHKTMVPKLGVTEPVSVCVKCFHLVTGPDKRRSMDPVDNNRPPIMDNTPPIAVKLPTTFHYSQNNTDKDLHDRLERLRRERLGTRKVSQDEVESRLSQLKGKPQFMSMDQPDNSAAVYQAPDVRSSTMKTSDLMTEMMDEISLEKQVKTPDQVIADRLARLKGEKETVVKRNENVDVAERFLANEGKKPAEKDETIEEMQNYLNESAESSHNQAQREMNVLEEDDEISKLLEQAKKKQQGRKMKSDEMCSDEDDSNSETDMIIDQAIADNELESKLAKLSPPEFDTEPSEKNDELPWCVICNEDAVLRCTGCDFDLYCNRCYREGHEQFDLVDHKSVPFRP